MEIYQRINSRKIFLSFLYEMLYFMKLSKYYDNIEEQEAKKTTTNTIILSFEEENETKEAKKEDRTTVEKEIIDDVNFRNHWELKKEEFENIRIKIKERNTTWYHEFLSYQLSFAYENRKGKKTDLKDYSYEERLEKEIDEEYLQKMEQCFHKYDTIIKDQVNQHTTTFPYQDMDIMDQAIFLLAYTEFMEFHTPKEILIVEMVELAKRYSRDGSAKLIHGILHYILN